LKKTIMRFVFQGFFKDGTVYILEYQ